MANPNYITYTSRIKSSTADGVLLETDQMLDKAQNKLQSAINAETKTALADRYTKAEVDQKVSNAAGAVYRPKGSKATIAEVIALTNAKEGDVWNVEQAFTLAGKKFPASTNVVCVTATTAQAHAEANWDALGGTVDLAPYATTAAMNTAIAASAAKKVGALKADWYSYGSEDNPFGISLQFLDQANGSVVCNYTIPVCDGNIKHSGLITGAEKQKLAALHEKPYMAELNGNNLFKLTTASTDADIKAALGDGIKLEQTSTGAWTAKTLDDCYLQGLPLRDTVSGGLIQVEWASDAWVLHETCMRASVYGSMQTRSVAIAIDTATGALSCKVAAYTGYLYPATTKRDGLMSAADKTKLDGLSNYTLPAATADALGGIKADEMPLGKGATAAMVYMNLNNRLGVPVASATTSGVMSPLLFNALGKCVTDITALEARIAALEEQLTLK